MIKKILIFLTLIVLVIIGYIVYNNHKTTPTGTSVNIVNVDDLGVNLSGAGLQVINQNNEIIDSWISNGKVHTISGLQEGFYQLEETAAPTGYFLNSSSVLFEIDKEGNIINNGEKVTIISITNYNNGFFVSVQSKKEKKELIGANLIIKNKNGTEVINFTSTDKPHMIKGIPEGEYTITETEPPEGYKLNCEPINFKIDSSGKIIDKESNVTSQIIIYHE